MSRKKFDSIFDNKALGVQKAGLRRMQIRDKDSKTPKINTMWMIRVAWASLQAFCGTQELEKTGHFPSYQVTMNQIRGKYQQEAGFRQDDARFSLTPSHLRSVLECEATESNGIDQNWRLPGG
jgi:hypothetical protein